MNNRYYVVLMLILFVFTGCSTKPKKSVEAPPVQRTPPPAFTNTPPPPTSISSEETRLGSSIPTGETTSTTEMTSIPGERIVYFDYDRSHIKVAAQAILEQHATYLTNNPNISVRLEGHADERGSREYNLALGERRAESVRSALNALGVFDNQLTTLSYGEEQPIARSHHEDAWRLNRRVELVYP